MLENILGLATGATLTDLGALAAITSIIVQVLKQILPKSFPTKALTIIVAVVVSIVAALLCYGVILKAFGVGILLGFVTAFVAMNGFDSLKSIWERFTNPKIEEVEEESGEG